MAGRVLIEKMNFIVITYLILINLTAFIAYGADKQKAKRHAFRIPERTLIGLALIGGSVGALAAMSFFRHKTRHLKFKAGIPLILTVQLMVWFLMRSIRL